MNNFLIAESGATKTDWCFVENGKIVESFITEGFNPFFTSPAHISSEMNQAIGKLFRPDDIQTLYFYGAGCSSSERCNIIRIGMRSVFPVSGILIDTDLTAAARALFPEDEGIAVILGTGSNSCYCNAGKIENKFNSLGYILGDEGSGNHMGRKLLKAWLQNELPAELNEAFGNYLNLPAATVLDKIYREPFPNRFLASFSKFIFSHIDHPYLQKLVTGSFDDFFINNLSCYPQFPGAIIRCTGGIAYRFRAELESSAQKYGAVIASVIPSPIEALVNYHLSGRK